MSDTTYTVISSWDFDCLVLGGIFPEKLLSYVPFFGCTGKNSFPRGRL